jgi:diguanylate cyclase (GGDEF)-like protein
MARSVPSYARTLAVCGLIAGTAMALNVMNEAATERERAALVRDEQRIEELSAQATTLIRTVGAEMLAVGDFRLSRDPADAERYQDAAVEHDRLTATLSDAARDLPGVVAALDALSGATDAWQTIVAEPVLASSGATSLTDIADLRAPVDRAASSLLDQLARARSAVHERDLMLATSRQDTLTAGVIAGSAATVVALIVILRFGRSLARDARHSAVINRFTESTAYARNDLTVAASNLEALSLLVHMNAGVVHILNRSQDRAVPESSVGDAIVEVHPIKALTECPGMLRGNIHVTPDARDVLSVRCPVYPATSGTLACVPLISGEPVGAVHLHWDRPGALPLRRLGDVNRLAQHAALAIANRRLLAALQGQASTDARTGLSNSRSFDVALEGELTNLSPGGSLSVLMLDLDHFKDFNDRYGHPAGDEALRAFASVLLASIREQDLAARYGGEEFTVLLRGLSASEAVAVAERIRQRAESAVIPLAPGQTARITVSIGAATAPDQGTVRVRLLRAADEALYQAKEAGRNRVSHVGHEDQGLTRPVAVA